MLKCTFHRFFPVDTEDAFLELHTLSNLAEMLQLARYVGKSASKDYSENKYKNQKPSKLFFTEKERHCIRKLN